MTLVLPSIPAPTVPLMDPQNPNVWNRVWYDYFKALDMVERGAGTTGPAGTVVAMGSQDISAFNGAYSAAGVSGDAFTQAYTVSGILVGDVIAWSIRSGWATGFIVEVYSTGANNLSMFICNTRSVSRTFNSGNVLDYAVIRAD